MHQWPCARCSQPLRRMGRLSAVTWKCDPCSLSWVTRTSLVCVLGRELLKKLTDQIEAAPPATRALTCPECKTASFRMLSVGPIEIDICSTCHGLILDPGEAVEAIHQQLDPQRLSSAMTQFGYVEAGTGLGDIACLVFEVVTKLIP